MQVRAPRRDEAPPLRSLRLRALADAPRELGDFLAEEREFPPSYWENVADFSAIGTDRVVLVAVEGAAFVGMAGGVFRDAAVDTAEVVAVWVEPAARGRGVARRLVDAIVDWARARGARRAELWVVDDNPAADALYRRAGFTPTGRREPTASAPDVCESLLARAL
jgi:GNAT superfamily N-acetyltransferase